MNSPHYLIAKYIPDLQRVEPRNIGIIVWTPESVEARFLAEKTNQPGSIDGRSIPSFVTSATTYRQWITYWREQIKKIDIIPATGGEKVSRRSRQFLDALMSANRGNYVLAEGGYLLDAVEPEDLEEVADHLYNSLVEMTVGDEPRDLSLDEKCDQLFQESRLATNPMFKPRYVVECPVGTAREEFEFSYGIGNGVPYYLYQRLPLPKAKRNRQKNVNDTAWKFEKVIDAKVLSSADCGILVYPTEEQRNEPEIDRAIQVLRTITNVLDLINYDQIRDQFSALSLPSGP